MHLGSIDIQAYDAFAKQHFQESGRKLADGVTQAVYESSKGITWYTQKLFNTLFALTEKGETCTVDMDLPFVAYWKKILLLMSKVHIIFMTCSCGIG